jgi:hypothetical protein
VIWKAYVRSTKGGGALIKSTSSGGSATIQTTSAAGGGQTTSAGGGQTSSAGGDHRHLMFSAVGFQEASNPNSSVILRAASGNTIAVDSDTAAGVEYYTEGSSGNHTHTVQDHVHYTDDHTHQVTVKTPSHSHAMEIPEHQHEMEFGIFELDRLPTAVTIKVDGNIVPYTEISGEEIDLVPYVKKDENGKIIRGRWCTIEIIPNDLGRINASIESRVFINSHIGGTY